MSRSGEGSGVRRGVERGPSTRVENTEWELREKVQESIIGEVRSM